MPKLADLLADILEKTEAGRLSWETSGSDSYRVIFDGAVGIVVSRRVIPGTVANMTRYVVAVIDNKGETIESVSSESAHQIFDAARRSALKIDEKIDILKKKLDSL